MRIVVCAKEVLDPDAVNNYALEGKLVIGEDGRTLTQAAIPRLMNAYDEQAIEAALRVRDAGVTCKVTIVSIGPEPTALLRHAAAMGADEIVAISADVSDLDCQAVAALLAAYVRHSGGADLILCGRQASDDDQGVVPAVMGELLGMPVVPIARAVVVAPGGDLRVTRVTPDGDEIVEVRCPAVVTISSEIGQARYPTTARKMAVRRMQPTAIPVEALPVAAEDRVPRVRMVRQFVPTVQGQCDVIAGATAAEAATRLVARLRADGVLA
ncbi:MAG: electron transfer flavoprotein subunit beta/FixA family protein [Candidatus Binatia bacterium]